MAEIIAHRGFCQRELNTPFKYISTIIKLTFNRKRKCQRVRGEVVTMNGVIEYGGGVTVVAHQEKMDKKLGYQVLIQVIHT